MRAQTRCPAAEQPRLESLEPRLLLSGTLSLVEGFTNGAGAVDGLNGAQSVAVTPDGKFAYAVGAVDDAVAIFSRDSVTGQLTFRRAIKQGVDGVNYLDGASGVAISPDGKHVYVASAEDDNVSVFSRDRRTGDLTIRQILEDGAGGMDGLDMAFSVAISPNGKNVYVAGVIDCAVAVFSRDARTGNLTFRQVLKDGVGGADGLTGVRTVTVSPDGKHVYAAGYGDDALVVFSRDSRSGDLTFSKMLQDGVGGVDGLDGVFSASVSRDGKHVYAAAYFDNAVAVFSRDTRTGDLTFRQMLQDGVGGVDGLWAAESVIVSRNGKSVYAAGAIDGAVAVFSRDTRTGDLTFRQVLQDGVGGVDGLNGAALIAASPNGRHLYVAAYVGDAVAVFSRDSRTGDLTFSQARKDGTGGVEGLDGATGVAISPDGKHVYAAGFWDNALSVYSRNSTTGALTFRQVVRDDVGGVDGLNQAFAVTVSPDGKHVYAAGFQDDAVAVFSRNAATGELTFLQVLKDGAGGVDGLDGAIAVTTSPDGKHVYVAGYMDDTVAVFTRDTKTGLLTFRQMLKDNVGGVDGLSRICAVTASADGKYLYTAAGVDAAVTVFSRNAATGELTFQQVLKDGVGGVDGLNGARSVIVSRDGKNVYAAGMTDDAVVVFSRDTRTGLLTFRQMIQDGAGGIDGLDGAFSVAIAPNGRTVYLAGSDDDAVTGFTRDVGTGLLAFRQVLKDGLGGIDTLNGARAIIVSPDGKHAYVAGAEDDTLTVFRVS